MAQFDLYRLNGGQLVVDLQADLVGIEASRAVAPLREASRYTAFPGTELRERVGSRAGHRDALKRALAILIDWV